MCSVTRVAPPATFDPGFVWDLYAAITVLIGQRNWDVLCNYYAQRCLITSLNETVDKVNTYMLNLTPGETTESRSIDKMNEDCLQQVPVEVLNTFKINGFPVHCLTLKVGMPVVLLRNLNLAKGLCNGTRLVVTGVAANALRCRVITGKRAGDTFVLPRINLLHSGNDACPFTFYRFQFPIRAAYTMTINKAQGQSLERVAVLLPQPVFTHGQLYVAMSRCTSVAKTSVCLVSDQREHKTGNIVYHPILAE